VAQGIVQAPSWLRNIALANPARAASTAYESVAIMGVLGLVSIVLGARAFGRAVA